MNPHSLVILTADRSGSRQSHRIFDEATGAAFAADGRTIRFLEALQRGASEEDAALQAGLTRAQGAGLLASLRAERLVEGDAPPPPRPPLEMRLISLRLDLLDITGFAKRAALLLGPLFSMAGVILWLALLAAAAYALTGQWERLLASQAVLPSLRGLDLLALLAGAAALKTLHELGHAVALIRYLRAESLPLRPIRAGLMMFALFPFPYTDCTQAWALRSRWRRAAVALAGVYVESWASACLVLLWSQTPDGFLAETMLRLIVLSGLSTLLFNLNPLVRLDGYFALSDLTGAQNLAPRAARAAQFAGVRALGGAAPRPDPALMAWWLASFAYRVTIFSALIWAGWRVNPLIGWLVAAISASILVIRPAARTLRMARARGGARPRNAAVALALAALVAAAVLTPLPHPLRMEAVVLRHDAITLRAGESARVLSVAAEGELSGAPVLLESPALSRRRQELSLQRDALQLAAKAQSGRDPALFRRFSDRAAGMEAQIEELRTRLERLRQTAPRGAIWRPDPQLAARSGGWLSANPGFALGALAAPSPVRLRARLAGEAPPILNEPARFRAYPPSKCAGDAVVTRIAPGGAARNHVLVDLAPGDAASCLGTTPEGAAVAVRVDRPARSVGGRLVDALARTADRASLGLTRTAREAP